MPQELLKNTSACHVPVESYIFTPHQMSELRCVCKEDTILVYRRGTNGIQNGRKPQCTKYKIVLYRQSYQVGYWRVPTVRYLPLSRLSTLSPHFSQEGTNQLRVPSRSYNTAGAILWLGPFLHTGEQAQLENAWKKGWCKYLTSNNYATEYEVKLALSSCKSLKYDGNNAFFQ